MEKKRTIVFCERSNGLVSNEFLLLARLFKQCGLIGGVVFFVFV